MTAPFRIVKFWTEYREAGKDPLDWVMLAPYGEDFESTQTPHIVNKLRPPEGLSERDRRGNHYAAMIARWEHIGPAYDAWKRGEEIPDSGTPLAAWSGLNPSQARIFRENDVRTVEELASMNDVLVDRIKLPNARRYPQLAKQWLESQDVAAKDAENEALKERLAALEAQINEAPKKAAPKGAPPKKKAEAA